MGHGNTDVLLSSDSGSVGFSQHGEGPPDSSAGWTPGNFEGFLLDTCFSPELGSLYLYASGAIALGPVQACDIHEKVK